MFRIAPARRHCHPQGRSAAEDAAGVDQVEHWGRVIFLQTSMSAALAAVRLSDLIEIQGSKWRFWSSGGGRFFGQFPSCSNVLKIQGEIRFLIQWLARLKNTFGAAEHTFGAAEHTFGAN
jgi:hypothetical protein